MATETERLFSELTSIAKRIAWRINKMSGGLIDEDDALQEAYSWLYSHLNRVDRHRSNGILNADQVISDAMDMALSRWVRREMDAITHIDLRQQVYYTRENVEASLALLWTDEAPAKEADISGIRTQANHARAGTLRAEKADLRRAIKAVTGGRVEAVLMARHCLGMTWEQVGASVGCTPRTARKYSEDAILAITDYLNGLHPVPAEGPGTREVLSNEDAAQVSRGGGVSPDWVQSLS